MRCPVGRKSGRVVAVIVIVIVIVIVVVCFEGQVPRRTAGFSPTISPFSHT